MNVYLIKGRDRNLLIDTGFNHQVCLRAIEEALCQLHLSMMNTDIFLTHVHSDYCGLAGRLQSAQSKIYCSAYTAHGVNGKDEKIWGAFDEMMEQSGLWGLRLEDHPRYAYASDLAKDIIIVKDQDVLEVGAYRLVCIETSGHAPQHMCLYDEMENILISGDHILEQITLNNTIWSPPWQSDEDMLGEYLRSLEKIRELNLKRVFPGHRGIVSDCKRRIRELEEHQQRMNEIVKILSRTNAALCGVEVAAQMKWRIRTHHWDQFAIPQKIFATGEAMAHLVHLQSIGLVKSFLKNRVVYYSLL